jgi:hypothetical protein
MAKQLHTNLIHIFSCHQCVPLAIPRQCLRNPTQTIDEMQALPPERHYAKVVPIAQSSGTGKSKTVDKIATERILLLADKSC